MASPLRSLHLVLLAAGALTTSSSAHPDHAPDSVAGWQPVAYAPAAAHQPTPLPDRIVLTWNDDPATTQAVTWRTDVSIPHGVAEIAVANSNGRALEPVRTSATTTSFESDLGAAHYHTVTFNGLTPDTLYAYRVGDGVNWSEYFHFRTARAEPAPFTFVYFGDAQNDLKTHWSRVFREAFRTAPRAAFTLHAGDLINRSNADAEWGEWHGAPAWVNATIPVIATPGNHEYYRENQGPRHERLWRTSGNESVRVDVDVHPLTDDAGTTLGYHVDARTPDGRAIGRVTLNANEKVTAIDAGVAAFTGFRESEVIGGDFDDPPIDDRIADNGTPAVSRHWRPQFAFPVSEGIPPGLEETCYSLDYQGARIISLDSSRELEAQARWLRRVLEENPQRWTILTFHHPVFSPARNRDNPALRTAWKPLFDEFKVDLVLNGHDHSYARAGVLDPTERDVNVPTGLQTYDPKIGTVYVVSVSGPKMYDVTRTDFKRVAEDTQLYQIITVDGDELHFEARTATNQLYDTFTLKKRPGEPNALIESLPPQNRRQR